MQNQITVDDPPSPVTHPVSGLWHVITSEYPPEVGGVSDYTHAVAAALASCGDDVHVWCPAGAADPRHVEGVTVHRELGRMTPADLRHADRQLDRYPGPRRILVQWVPHGYGFRSMNLAFCLWLWNRAARHGDQVEIVLHEPSLPFRASSLRSNIPAVVHRIMAMILLRAANHVWMAIPAWEDRWRPYALGRRIPFEWLPIPSTIPVAWNQEALQAVRRRYAPSGGLLIGHIGTYGSSITSMLEPVLSELVKEQVNQTVLLMGKNSDEFRDALVRREPQFDGFVHSTGALSAADLSSHVAACDLLIQPYPDGASSRRTSLMAGLCHGIPVVTNSGHLTEPLWKETNAITLAPTGDPAMLLSCLRKLRTDVSERQRMGHAAAKLYRERFDISQTIAALRRSGASRDASCES